MKKRVLEMTIEIGNRRTQVDVGMVKMT